MTELKFDEAQHKYTYGDRELTSVTQWLGEFEEPFDVKEVSKRYAKWLRNSGYMSVEGKKITAKRVQNHWDWVREEGTRVHRQIEGLIQGEKIFPYPTHGAEEAYKYIKGQLDKLDNPTTEPEQRVHSLRHGLAGSIDLPVYYDNGHVFIYDWKIVEKMTPKKLKKYTLQLSTYAYILETEANQKVDGLKLIQVQNSGITEHIIEYKKDKVIEMLKASGRY